MATISIFKHHVQPRFILLGVLDLLILFASVFIAAYLRFFGDSSESAEAIGPLAPRALMFAVVMMVSMSALGLYQSRLREPGVRILLRIVVSFMLGGTFLVILFYAIPELYLGRGALILSCILSFFIMGTLRPIFLDATEHDRLKHRVLVLGTGDMAADITKRLRRKADQKHFRIVGYVRMNDEAPQVEARHLVELSQPLAQFAEERRIDEIVVAVDDRRGGIPLEDLLQCRLKGVEVVDLVTFFERQTGKVRVDLLQPSWLIFSAGYQQGGLRESAKRLSDIVCSLILLLVALPFMLITFIAIRIEDGLRAPIIYRQERVGKDGEVFGVLKFRSMRVDAESNGQAVWASEQDPRITKVGNVIRKLRIDELPQILNVLRGEMSMVGPRPERPQFVDELNKKIPYYAARHSVQPGITGWAQLCYPYGATEQDAMEKLQYDLYYIKNQSLFLDWLVMLQTVEVILFGRGAR